VHRAWGESGVKAGCCRVHTRRGADNPERRQSLPVGDQERHGWEARLHRMYPGGRGGEAGCGLPLDLAPECFKAGCCAHAGCEQIRTVEQDTGNQ